MIDQNHPPGGRLTDQQRAMMRADLMAATQDAPKTARRWLAPLAIAASVAALVGVGVAGVALRAGDDGRTTGVPAAGTGSDAPSTRTDTPGLTPPTRPNAEELGRQQCDESVIYQDGFENAQVADSVSYDGGTTYLYESGQGRWLCDDWRTRIPAYNYFSTEKLKSAIMAPVISVARSVGDRSLSAERFEIHQASMPDEPKTYAMDPDHYDGGFHTQLLAGGVAPDGVAAISYAFPTGEVVEATVTDTMWQMVSVTPSDTGYHEGWSDPVVVTVTKADGSTQEFELADPFGSCDDGTIQEVFVGGC
jgi:hypothetical protein